MTSPVMKCDKCNDKGWTMGADKPIPEPSDSNVEYVFTSNPCRWCGLGDRMIEGLKGKDDGTSD
jgi:hypothetical protein